MKKAMPVFLICLMLLMTSAFAEDFTGSWYVINRGVTVSKIDLLPDGTCTIDDLIDPNEMGAFFGIIDNEQPQQMTWQAEKNVISLPALSGTFGFTGLFVYTGTGLSPYFYQDAGDVIVRTPTKINSEQFLTYLMTRTLPDGMTEQEIRELEQYRLELFSGAAAAPEQNGLRNDDNANKFDFSGVWVHDDPSTRRNPDDYFVIFDDNPVLLELSGDGIEAIVGEEAWTKEENVLKSGPTTLTIRDDGQLELNWDFTDRKLRAKWNRTYKRLFRQAEAVRADSIEDFYGDWVSAGFIYKDSGYTLFQANSEYKISISDFFAFQFNQQKGTIRIDNMEFSLFDDDTIRAAIPSGTLVLIRKPALSSL